MPPDPFTDLDPDQTVRVLPRHLAGAGPAHIDTVWPFPFDEDWTLRQSDEGTAYATSPCLRLWTRLTPRPEKPGQGRWTIGANRVPFGRPDWQVTFDATTPAELLHDVHCELGNLYLEDRHSSRDWLFEDLSPSYEAYAPLLACGWSHYVKTDGTQDFVSPEGLGGVRHRYVSDGPNRSIWRVWAGYAGAPYWQAYFSRDTPTALAEALIGSLLSTEPLHRAVKDVPVHTRQHLRIATTVPKRLLTHSPAAPPPAAPAARTR
ncbi:DUF317 domain-containing protein [Streptomyces sp. NPDC004690]